MLFIETLQKRSMKKKKVFINLDRPLPTAPPAINRISFPLFYSSVFSPNPPIQKKCGVVLTVETRGVRQPFLHRGNLRTLRGKKWMRKRKNEEEEVEIRERK